MEDAVDNKNKREAMAEELALMTIQGVGINKSVDQLSQKYDLTLTRAKVASLKSHPKYLDVLQKEADAQIAAGKAEALLKIVELLPIGLKSLERIFKQGGPPAVAAFAQIAKIAGFETAEPQGKQAQLLQVILPGAKPTDQVIEVKSETKD